VKAFRFVEHERATLPVTTMCRVLGVSSSGYWAWASRPPLERSRGDAALSERIRAIHERSRRTYGVPRAKLSAREGESTVPLLRPAARVLPLATTGTLGT